MREHHTILGGKVHVYKRENSSYWQCSTYLAGKNRRISTKEESLSKAKEIAEDWYLQLRGKLRSGEIKTEKTFARRLRAVPARVRDHHPGPAQRRSTSKASTGALARPPGAVLRQHGPLGDHARPGPGIPHPSPTGGDGEVRQAARRATRIHQEIVDPAADAQDRHPPRMARPPARPVRALRSLGQNLAPRVVLARGIQEALRGDAQARARAEEPALQMGIGAAPRLRPVHGQHRPAARRSEPPSVPRRRPSSRTMRIGETILEIEVRGKRGVGYCKSMPGAVRPFERLKARNAGATQRRRRGRGRRRTDDGAEVRYRTRPT